MNLWIHVPFFSKLKYLYYRSVGQLVNVVSQTPPTVFMSCKWNKIPMMCRYVAWLKVSRVMALFWNSYISIFPEIKQDRGYTHYNQIWVFLSIIFTTSKLNQTNYRRINVNYPSNKSVLFDLGFYSFSHDVI